MADANLQSRDGVPEVELAEGVTRRTLNHGDRTSIHEITIKKDGIVPLHTHPHEQIGYLVSGRLLFEMDGESKELRPGDSWIVPSEVEHGVTGLEDCVAVDIFSPVREEYLD